MTRRSSSVAIGLLLAVGLTGCASGSAQPVRSTRSVPPARPSSSTSNLDVQFAHNREQATDQARRVLAYAVIPPAAQELPDQPPGLTGPALGMPNDQTYVDIVKYYRVPLALPAATAFVRSHPPAGFIDGGTSRGIGANENVGYAWDGPTNSPDLGQLSMVLAPDGSAGSYLRVDAGENLLDPRPIKDSQPGPRLRIEQGQPCPAGDRGMVGVRNPGIDLSRQLAPDVTATGGLLCSYSGFNGNRQALLSSRTLTAAEAARLGRLAHQVELSHPDGLHSCPFDDGSAQALVLDYPSRSAVDLWLQHRGCTSVSNGQVVAGGGANEAALLDATR